MTIPQDCPRYGKCSANVCPLDQKWRQRTHARGDEVCFWLMESVKNNAAVNFASLGAGWLWDIVNNVRDDPALPFDIKNTVERAKSTGSRIVNARLAGARLKQGRK